MGLPLTYPDLVCEDDLDPFAAETTNDLQNLTQDVYHILVELPGSNPDDPSRGVGVETYLSGTADKFYSLGGRIDAQLSSDDRITSSKTTITQNPDGGFTVGIDIKVGADVLPLQFGVGAAGVSLL